MTTAAPLGPSASDVPPSGARLRRSDSDRMVAGVCGGLAAYTGIDATLWRVAFVALTVLGGSGVLFYALLWVLVPASTATPSTPLDRGVERLRTAVEDVAARLHRR